MILTSFLSTTYTKADFYHRLSLLREFFEFLFYSKLDTDFQAGFKEFVVKKSLSEEDQKSLASLPTDFYNFFTQKNLYQNLEDLKKEAENLPVLTIYLSASLQEPYVSQLGSWVRSNLSKQALIDLKTDSKVSAGCNLAWKGLFSDYSLRSHLKQRGEVISQILSSYGQKEQN